MNAPDRAPAAGRPVRPVPPVPSVPPVLDEDAAVARAVGLARSGTRRLLGLAGAPGAGKSTLAERVVVQVRDALGADAAVLVPMDGFHLAQSELERLGRADRKGAPDTFDAAGFVALLRRVRAADHVVWAPRFERTLEEPVAGAIAVEPGTPLVVVEGNYLLLGTGPWADVARVLDETWFLQTDEAERVERLVRRHVRFGKTPDAARAWVLGPDQRNADLVAATRDRADVVVRVA